MTCAECVAILEVVRERERKEGNIKLVNSVKTWLTSEILLGLTN